MSDGKPDDIPQDVWDIANEIASSFQMPGGEGHATLREEIARAIMAAKAGAHEEAASITDAVAEAYSQMELAPYGVASAQWCGAAIREWADEVNTAHKSEIQEA